MTNQTPHNVVNGMRLEWVNSHQKVDKNSIGMHQNIRACETTGMIKIRHPLFVYEERSQTRRERRVPWPLPYFVDDIGVNVGGGTHGLV